MGASEENQRRAWNEAMFNSGAGNGNNGHAHGNSIVGARRAGSNRRSDRHKKLSKQARRNQARKSTNFNNENGEGGDGANLDQAKYQAALRIDALEGTIDHGLGADGVDGDDEYDELESLLDSANGDDDYTLDESEKSKFSSKRKRGKSTRGGRNKKNNSIRTLPKRLKARSLASLLIEDSTRPNGVTQKYLAAEARPHHPDISVTQPTPPQPFTEKQDTNITPTHTNLNTKAIITTKRKNRPKRKFCPVTGLFGIYTDPKSGIPYANLQALEQIRERAPPWLNTSNSTYVNGNATYFEATNSLRGNE